MHLAVTRTRLQCSRCKRMRPMACFVIVDGYRKPREAKGVIVRPRTAYRQYRSSFCRACKKSYDLKRRAARTAEQVAADSALAVRRYLIEMASGHGSFYRGRARAKQRGARISVTLAQWRELISSNTCHWCGTADLHPSIKHVDHIVPLSQGGEHSRSNLVIACANCNTRRSWEQKTKYVKERDMILGVKV